MKAKKDKYLKMEIYVEKKDYEKLEKVAYGQKVSEINPDATPETLVSAIVSVTLEKYYKSYIELILEEMKEGK